MTILDALNSPIRIIFITVLLLLIVSQLYLTIAAFGNARSRKLRIIYIIHFLFSCVLLYLFFFRDSWNLTYPGTGKPFPGFYSAFCSLPMYPVYIYEGLTLVSIAAGFQELISYRRNHLTADSIKETLDLLPVGIAFAGRDGAVVFRNVVMNEISQSVIGKRLTDIKELANDEDRQGETDGEFIGQIRAAGTDSVWQTEMRSLNIEGQEYLQLTAADITRQAAITNELQEKNKKLRDIRMRLDIYNKHADRMIIFQELLGARMTVHNEVGNVLLESRHYMNNPESIDEEILLNALKNTNTCLLREYEEDDTERDPLADALELAEAIGVEVNLTGVIPSAGDARSILSAAINECATNTVKHAQGDLLNVDISKADSQLIFRLGGNGIPPEGTVQESGGLASLRVLVENAEGSMEISPAPDFHVTIMMPEKA